MGWTSQRPNLEAPFFDLPSWWTSWFAQGAVPYHSQPGYHASASPGIIGLLRALNAKKTKNPMRFSPTAANLLFCAQLI